MVALETRYNIRRCDEFQDGINILKGRDARLDVFEIPGVCTELMKQIYLLKASKLM